MPERTPAEPARSAPPVAVFRRERTVGDADTDALGHVNNVVWVRWLIDLTEAHAAAVGLPVDTIRTMGGVWVVHKQELDYHRGALPGETLRESTWVSEMHGATTVRHTRIENAEGAPCFSAMTWWVWVDPLSMRVRRVPKEMKERFVLLAPEGPDA
jgi:acyl-CoA thioester hydrolase